MEMIDVIRLETQEEHLQRVQRLFESRREEMRQKNIKHVLDKPVRRLDGRDCEYRQAKFVSTPKVINLRKVAA